VSTTATPSKLRYRRPATSPISARRPGPRLKASSFLAASIAVLLAICRYDDALAETARLEASFSPEHLGAPTTIFWGFRLSGSSSSSLVPLTDVNVLLPSEMGLATSGLGLENCRPSRLEEQGPDGCPSNSRMGRGSATAAIPIGGETVVESAQIDVFSAPVSDGHLTLLVYANAQEPVSAQLVFPATVVPAPPPYGEGVDTVVPLVPSLPEGPDVAVNTFHMALGTTTRGPDHFVYYRLVRGRRVSYSPAGLILPPTCPRGGFPFEAHFVFQDHTAATARTTVPCPRETPRGRRRHRPALRRPG
jgi:hypothetical protein